MKLILLVNLPSLKILIKIKYYVLVQFINKKFKNIDLKLIFLLDFQTFITHNLAYKIYYFFQNL